MNLNFRRNRRVGVASLVALAAAAVAALVGLGAMAGAEPLGPDVITSPDTGGNVGQYTSLTLDTNGNPVISYWDTTNDALKVLHCTNADCSGTQTPQTVDTGSVSGGVGAYTSLALDSNGYPVVSYLDDINGALKVVHCTNADCSGTQTPQFVDFGVVGEFTSLALDTNNNPVISYLDFGNGALKVVHCTNADCSGTQTPQTVDSTGDVGEYTSLALDTNGNPVISYYDLDNDDLKVLHCTNPNCTGTQTPQTVDSDGFVGLFTSLALDTNGNPVISYLDFSNGALKVVHCTNADCSGTQTPQTVDSTDTVGLYTSLALDTAGNPVISYYDNTNRDLKVVHCTNPDCSGTQTPQTVDSTGDVGQYTSLALDTYGNPVISYWDADSGDLKVLHCYDVGGCGGQDQDLDGVAHSADNCAAVANADQANLDGDSQGDACDSDDDNDNIADTADNCPTNANTNQADADADGVGNVCDPADGRIPSVCVGFATANLIIGTNAGETITGTSGRDVILGLGGDDTLVGLAGDDCILGGPGADVIRGKAGNDTIRGQKGADDIRGGSGSDDIRGGSGRDVIRGQRGADTIRGQKGADIIRGGSGADSIRGNSGNDRIWGNKGNDTINGGKGTDRCNGGAGTDIKTRCES